MAAISIISPLFSSSSSSSSSSSFFKKIKKKKLFILVSYEWFHHKVVSCECIHETFLFSFFLSFGYR